MCKAPSSTSAAAEGGGGKGSKAALPSHRVHRSSSQKKFDDVERPRNFEKQLQDLKWAAKMQRQAKSKGEKEWARRQVAKTKQKFAKDWLEKLEDEAKQSEVGKATGRWDSTAARHRFEKARKLEEAKERLWKKIKKKCEDEVKDIEKIDEELRGLRAAGDSSADREQVEVQIVAAVCRMPKPQARPRKGIAMQTHLDSQFTREARA